MWSILCIWLDSDLNDCPHCVSQLFRFDFFFLSHDALLFKEYLHYLHKDVVRHDIIAIALDYYLQYYYWIICMICSGLLCISTGLLHILWDTGFIPCYCLYQSQLKVVCSILSSTFLLDLHFKSTQPCFFKDIWPVFYKQYLMYLH